MPNVDDSDKYMLWNEDVLADYNDPTKRRDHLLQQYKSYVEMADRISERRSKANTFFLTLNTMAVAAMAASSQTLSVPPILFMCAATIVLCYVWKRIIKSYRQLNTAKYKVIGDIEKRLPMSPYWSAEWTALGEGKDPKLYTPLTAVESTVPIIFMVLYLLLALAHFLQTPLFLNCLL